MNQAADLTLIEGAGGWRVPLNNQETMAQLPILLQMPVVLVVGMRLGCINHALLTAEAIARDGLTLAAWVANGIMADMPAYAENVATLQSLINAPFLGQIPHMQQSSNHQSKIVQGANYLDLTAIGIGLSP